MTYQNPVTVEREDLENLLEHYLYCYGGNKDQLALNLEKALSERAMPALADECWQDLIEKDDRTSPIEYPDMALITRDELRDYLARVPEQIMPEPAAAPADDFPDDEFDEWLKGHSAFINGTPAVMSLLYDLNRLPEVVLTFRDRKMMRELVLIVEHFQQLAPEQIMPTPPKVEDVTPTANEVNRAAHEWCGQKGRETFNSDIEYFVNNWWALPGLKALVLAEVAKRPVPERAVPVARAIDDVAAERKRQVEDENWTPEHDNYHSDGSLSVAAACYALSAAGWKKEALWEIWPKDWGVSWFKPKNSRRDLVKAGALIVAEIERLDREAGVSSHAVTATEGGRTDG